jgi:hypothetical protein
LKFLVYFANLLLCNFTYSLMLMMIFSPKNNFSSLKDKAGVALLKRRSYLASIVFALAVMMLIFQVDKWYLAFLIIPLDRFLTAGRKRFSKGKPVMPPGDSV